MRAVGVKTLNNKLSEYLRIVAAGEVVLVIDRDRVVAELRPAGDDRANNIGDAQLAEMVRSGRMRPPLIKGGDIPPGIPVAPIGTILDELSRDREDR